MFCAKFQHLKMTICYLIKSKCYINYDLQLKKAQIVAKNNFKNNYFDKLSLLFLYPYAA